MIKSSIRFPREQHGIILATVLIFLLMLTVLGLSAMSGSVLQIHMSRSLHENLAEFEAAEMTLVIGEKHLNNAAPLECISSEPLPKAQQENPWLTKKTCIVSGANHMKGHYFIERLKDIGCVQGSKQNNTGIYYRITAWATVSDDGVPTILQSTYIQASQEICDEHNPATAHPIQAGRLAWRELS